MQDTVISDMINSMELERPRPTAVLPELDLGVIWKPYPYEPLRDFSLEHLYDGLPSGYGDKTY